MKFDLDSKGTWRRNILTQYCILQPTLSLSVCCSWLWPFWEVFHKSHQGDLELFHWFIPNFNWFVKVVSIWTDFTGLIFFFELRLGCLSYNLISHAIPQKIQSDLKSKGIAERDRLVRLIAPPLHWSSLANAADHFKWPLMWSGDLYSKLHFSWVVKVLVFFWQCVIKVVFASSADFL